jgi:hypothetical protein
MRGFVLLVPALSWGLNYIEGTGGWRKLHTEDLHNLYSQSNHDDKMKGDEMDRTCSTHGRGGECMHNLVYGPGFETGSVMWDFVVDKVALG